MRGFPVTLVGLAGQRCVVVGGGRVAARKVASLIEAGARPVVISPVLCQVLQERADRGQIEAVGRAYEPGDLAGARLVVAATDDAATNEAVWNEAQAVGCLVNVVDDPPHCNIHIPATLRRGALTISISTGGNSPGLARRIRQSLEQQYDVAYEPYLDLLGELRSPVQEQVADPVRRKALWEALLDSDVLALLRAGESQAAQRRAQDIVASFQ